MLQATTGNRKLYLTTICCPCWVQDVTRCCMCTMYFSCTLKLKCDTLYSTSCMLYVVCCMLYVVRCALYISIQYICCMLYKCSNVVQILGTNLLYQMLYQIISNSMSLAASVTSLGGWRFGRHNCRCRAVYCVGTS